MVLDSAINMESIVMAICSSQDVWQGVNTFAQCVMGRKKEDEKLEKQRKRDENRQDGAVRSDGVWDWSSDRDTDTPPDFDLETEEELELKLELELE